MLRHETRIIVPDSLFVVVFGAQPNKPHRAAYLRLASETKPLVQNLRGNLPTNASVAAPSPIPMQSYKICARHYLAYTVPAVGIEPLGDVGTDCLRRVDSEVSFCTGPLELRQIAACVSNA